MDLNKEQYFDNDELKIYRGEDFIISKYITIHQPTLGEICDFGENKYFNMINSFTATPQSMKAQLWKSGVDYTTITSYQLFNLLISGFSLDQTKILFGSLDFQKFQLRQKEDKSLILYQDIISGNMSTNKRDEYHFIGLNDAANRIGCKEKELIETLQKTNHYNDYYFYDIKIEPVIIDEYTYSVITDYLCKSHFIEQDLKVPMNESTKMILIEDAIDELERVSKEKTHSRLKNLISAMINSEGFKYNHSQVWDMKINAFMDSVKRIQTIKNANLLLQSGYSGFGVDMSKIDKKSLDWLGELN